MIQGATRARRNSCIVAVIVLMGLWGCGEPSPTQIHLGVQGDPATSVTVSWVTVASPDALTPRVKYGSTPGNYTTVVDGTSHPLPNEPWGSVHEAILTGLSPDTRYYYVCGNDADGWSAEYSFTTAPGSPRNFRFAVLGDMGTSSAAQQNLNHIGSENPDLILHAGDLSYANGLTPIWDLWFDEIAPVAARIPYLAAIGNHEDEPIYGLSSYLGRFSLPGNERWYSLDWGNVHFVCLDTESPYDPGSEQTTWLESDLASANADPLIDWIVVFFHKPPYSASFVHGSSLSVRRSICPVLDAYGVDIVFNGHDHDYERSYPLKNEAVVDWADNVYYNPGGTIYVVTGGGGALLYGVGSDYWTAYSRSAHQHMIVDVAGTEIHMRSISAAGAVLDEAWIYK